MANNYPRPIKLRGMLAKTETVEGEDAIPTAADNGIRVKGTLRIKPQYAFPNKAVDFAPGSIIGMPRPAPPKGKFATVDVEIALPGAGATYSLTVFPAADPLLVATGMSQTVDPTVGSESVTYALVDTGHGSCTIYAYGEDGKLYKLIGCRGTAELPISAGQQNTIHFTISGIVSSITEADLPSITYDAALPPAAVGVGLVIANSGDTWDPPHFSTAAVRWGANVQRMDDGNASDGIEGFYIPDFDPEFEITARMVDLATYDFDTALESSLSHTVDLTIGSVQYNRCAIDINESYLDTHPDPGDENGFATGRFVYKLRDLALVFD